jgi:hypothetical protein
MSHKIEGNTLSIEFNPNSKDLSQSGKTYLLESSKGFIWYGDIGISYNIVKRK